VNDSFVVMNGPFTTVNGSFIVMNGPFFMVNGPFIVMRGAFIMMNDSFIMMNGPFVIEQARRMLDRPEVKSARSADAKVARFRRR
jgi:hypothetical protein